VSETEKKIIKELTPEQEARQPEFVERWVEIGLSTEPLDRQKVEEAVKLAYACAELPPPATIEYVASPIAMAKKICQLKGQEATPKNLDAALQDVHWNNHNVGYLAFYDYAREVLGLAEDTKTMAGLWECARSFGWWAPYENVAVIQEKPRVIRLDNRGRLHRHDGKAVEYSDGWGLYAWHGTIIPLKQAKIIDNPQEITLQDVDHEKNAEIRRVMIERRGAEWYVRESKAEVLDRCPPDHKVVGLRDARLLRRPLEDDEPIVMLDLLNSTREPDGSTKRYMQRVPPTMKTCLEAHAWLNSKRTAKYQPVAES
jgi:hypothetical protein